MSDAFGKWFHNTMIPAECDDERVVVGLKICWNDALLHAAEIANAYSLEVSKPDGTDIVQLGRFIANEIQKEMTCE